jgi:hypothetical protein
VVWKQNFDRVRLDNRSRPLADTDETGVTDNK